MKSFDNSNNQNDEGASRGLKPSKKFANSSVHENGTGKFEILDRYLDNNIIMLKFKWLTGEFEGQTEINKEVNVNASIWKFDKVRGRVGNDLRKANPEPSKIESMIAELADKLEVVHELSGDFQQWQVDMLKNSENLERKVESLSIAIDRLMHLSEQNATQIKSLLTQYDITSKLIEKI